MSGQTYPLACLSHAARTATGPSADAQPDGHGVSRLAARVRRIAVFRALHLGDLLLAVPALRALRAGFPGAELTLIGLPWAEGFARRFSRYIDRFVIFASYPGINEAALDPERGARFIAEQRAYGYDIVVQMHGSGRASNPFALALGGRITAGYYEGQAPAGLTLGLPYPDDQHEIPRNLGLATLLGCSGRGPRLEFPLYDDDRAEAKALLARLDTRDRPLIGIHAGSRAPARRWPPEYFAAVADHCARRFGARIVLTGGPGEEDTARQVAARMETPPLNVAGATSLGGLAALIGRLDLFISNDTGPAHIATAVDTPSVTIFGPVNPRRWAPLDQERHPIALHPVACSPCPYVECPIDHRCLRRLYPEAVSAAADALLARGAVACAV